MSLCDSCWRPGACCTSLHVNSTFWVEGTTPEAVASHVEEQLRERGLPFKVLRETGRWLDSATSRWYGEFLLTCPKLTPEGRCSIYQDRPQLCRDYRPASDGLCVHYNGEAGDPTLGPDFIRAQT